MNTESAKTFIDKLATDKGFANEFKNAATVDGLVTLMHSEGFECTKEDFTEATSALTDEELEAVSGGGRDTNIAFLESYCKKITILGVQQECYYVLEKLRGSTE
jgi:predicted ribosomally synthesized peptide with nif11-like leader